LRRLVFPQINFMKISSTFLGLLIAAPAALAQGTFQYDQQSLNHTIPPNFPQYIQGNEPIGQSFTPSVSSVGFVQLALYDGHPNNGQGATVYVNIQSNSIAGPVLSSTDPVFLPDTPLGGGVTNFLFSTPVPVVPGTAYFFDVVVQSGDLWRLDTVPDLYPGGTMFLQGAAQPVQDIWFREGIIVPEPSMVALLITAGALFCVRRRQ